MTHSFIAYIDESGDEGFQFGQNKGSSRWFVVSCAVFHSATEPDDVKCVDRARIRLGKNPAMPLHFRDLKHPERHVYAQEVAKARMRVVNVCIDKREVMSRMFRKKMVLYHWACRLLLERVSWLCSQRLSERSNPVAGAGSVRIVFSHRHTMSMPDFASYLETLKTKPDVTIDWSIIDTSAISAHPHGLYRGLQIADVVASSFFSLLEPNRYGNIEKSYAQELMQRVYRHEDRVMSYGLKFFPSIDAQLFNSIATMAAE